MVTSEDIIKSALKLSQLDSWELVSMRKLAKEIGFSTMKLYSNFDSKETLFYEIQKRGFHLLEFEYDQAIVQGDSTELRLEKIFVAHVLFAVRYAPYYELMFNHKYNTCQTATIENKQKACLVINEVIASLSTENFELTFIHFFSLLEGFVRVIRELPDQSIDRTTQMARKIVKNFIRGVS